MLLSNRKKSQALEEKEQTQSQKAKQIGMEQEALEARREAAARQNAALTQRERAVTERENEMDSALETITDLVAQAESGDLLDSNRSENFERAPKFPQKIIETAPMSRTPVQRLLCKLVGRL
ncbi:hypothetical protein [uncultured Thioclava sp.]|uniref:hypothetical protein n=1 Tax=uncultured Thioclava sp. TaxID=473858 RepID=UPI0025DA05FD|nr:hypothetical protein [uncultured Thioclava sp.]